MYNIFPTPPLPSNKTAVHFHKRFSMTHCNLHMKIGNATYNHCEHLHFLRPFLCPWFCLLSAKARTPQDPSRSQYVRRTRLLQEPHLRSNRAVFSGYTALLPLTGMWYLISFQNLEDGERSSDGLWVAFSHFSSSWAPLKNSRHIGPRLRLFHQHTAPCFFLKWRTDSGNVASWAGLISSSSTRTTCKGGIRIE